LLKHDVAMQHLVGTVDEIRNDAVALLADVGRHLAGYPRRPDS
jgi:hypothetical protein